MPTLKTSYLGRDLFYPADSIIGRQIAAGGEWDPVLRPLVSALLMDESPVICEVGSNIGACLLQMLAGKPDRRFAFHIDAHELRTIGCATLIMKEGD